ncbi:hydroxyacylglutathione hydrolase [Parvibaculum sp.]|jgi:hydroxyacylglutathione hydrolase|uniref:hydroxyacylglutathione hydrolase n=1 Tax=Parvibaculum sp. TaxID=2024848 RepID=UPI000C5E3E73|nr:hydroxyacylglutathione hydrolase [Parvibaculum sp.]MAM93085.1 hydroxyacylglutathione hydrolase [Parvibaculum sp.]HCX66926.1 hydroxyacylglutathione hydrolase [Rhodobiaceae bacterium]|tara:strand:- start:14785 stop:15555 length:771 start_codon:yes stop_codon:yes gene_type:complete
MAKLEIHQFSCLNDNYGYLVHEPSSGATAAIDTPEVKPILAALEEKGWKLTHILNTHHHYDHAGGNAELKEKTGCIVIGPKGEKDKIPGIDRAVGEGDIVELGAAHARVIDVPGHTSGHIAYSFDEEHIAFVGDTLFALGCGRIFEGTPQQMWTSLGKLMELPDDTVVYCAHEYTQANARFALSVEPDNAALVARAREIDEKRARGEWTVPTTIGLEKKTNPFLRAASPDLRRTIGLDAANDVDVFAETRKRKDNF